MGEKVFDGLYRIGFDARHTADVSQIYASELMQLEPESVEFALEALVGLDQVISQLNDQGKFADNGEVARQGIREWLVDKQHGVGHSLNVFNRSCRFGDIEIDQGQINSYDPEKIKTRAILHDLGEFLPWVDLNTGKYIPLSLSDKQRRLEKHPIVMAKIIFEIGKLINIPDARQLGIDVAYHDYFWKQTTPEQLAKVKSRLSIEGMLVADADRFDGEVPEGIERNRDYSLGRWYILHPRLAPEDRLKWKPRTGAKFDGLCALMVEFEGDSNMMFTQAGQQMYESRRHEFRAAWKDKYGRDYEQGWEQITQAQNLHVGLRQKVNGEYIFVPNTSLVVPTNWSEMDQSSQIDWLKQIMNTPLDESGNSYGWSLSADGQLVDPSVLVYPNKAGLFAMFDLTIEAYHSVKLKGAV